MGRGLSDTLRKRINLWAEGGRREGTLLYASPTLKSVYHHCTPLPYTTPGTPSSTRSRCHDRPHRCCTGSMSLGSVLENFSKLL